MYWNSAFIIIIDGGESNQWKCWKTPTINLSIWCAYHVWRVMIAFSVRGYQNINTYDLNQINRNKMNKMLIQPKQTWSGYNWSKHKRYIMKQKAVHDLTFGSQRQYVSMYFLHTFFFAIFVWGVSIQKIQMHCSLIYFFDIWACYGSIVRMNE